MAMADKIFVINPGSASKKYALYEGEERRAFYHWESEGGKYKVSGRAGADEVDKIVMEREYQRALPEVLADLVRRRLLEETSDLAAIGLRVVAPGEFFQRHQRIDDEFLAKLETAAEWAQLHIGPARLELVSLRDPGLKGRLWAVSDSVFHTTLPPVAKNYAIDKVVAERWGIYRMGYHGISIESVVRKYQRVWGPLAERAIVCHLGSGSSMTALRAGKSVDTSMGFTPLEGLPMATRTGDIDPGALLFLGMKMELNEEELLDYINQEGGLKGLSGRTGDMRELLTAEAAGDPAAKLALAVYVWRVKKYLGAFAAVLGGLDVVILTATISERSKIMRARLLAEMEWLGINIDQQRNEIPGNGEGIISSDGSDVKVVVVATDELRQMAWQVDQLRQSG